DNLSVTSTGAPAPTASGNVSTGTFGLSYDAANGVNKVLLTNGQSWLSLGFAVGQQVFIPGYGVRTIVGYDNGVDGSGNPLVDGAQLPAVQITGPISLVSRYRFSGGLMLVGTTDGGTVTLPAGKVAASGLAVGMQVYVSGVNGTRTISAINGDVLTLTGGTIAPQSLTGTVAQVRSAGDDIRLTGPSCAGTLTATASTITRTNTATSDFVKDGFAVGQQIILGGGLTGIFTITNVTVDKVAGTSTITFSGGTLTP